ncbi:hypothetical protein SUDANB145_07198 (plasmid) [Streptomyces sp. enrichment culture]
MKALTADAIAAQLPDGRTESRGIKTITLSAIDRATAQANAIRAAIDKVQSKQVTITAVYHTLGIEGTAGRNNAKLNGFADGGIARAADGLFVPGYAPRRDIVPAILSPGEGVLVPETVRKLGLSTGLGGEGIITALNAWGRYGQPMRFADGGMVPQRFADGGVTEWRYDPQTGSLYSPEPMRSRTAGWSRNGSRTQARPATRRRRSRARKSSTSTSVPWNGN